MLIFTAQSSRTSVELGGRSVNQIRAIADVGHALRDDGTGVAKLMQI